MSSVNMLFVSQQNCANITNDHWMTIISNCFVMTEFCMAVRSMHSSSGAWPFLSTDISQRSVATRLRFDGIF